METAMRARLAGSSRLLRRPLVPGLAAAALLALLCSAAALLSFVPAAAALSFAPAAQYRAGYRPLAIAAGDLNGDGRRDLVTANFRGHGVTVLPGTGGGRFAAPLRFFTASRPCSVAVADMNGDGRSDVVTANPYDGVVSILFADGSGGFAPHVEIATGTAPGSVAAGDLNGDGAPDLVGMGGNTFGPALAVLLADGAGGFAAPVHYLPSGSSAATGGSVAIADVNADGHQDVIAALTDSETRGVIHVLLGDGSGALSVSTAYPKQYGPIGLAVADLNRDGKLDLAISQNLPHAGRVTALLGNGRGSFKAAGSVHADERTFGCLDAGDLDRDGRVDVAVISMGTGNVRRSCALVLRGNGRGGFLQPLSFAIGNDGRGIVAANLNGDHRLDLAATRFGNSVSVLLNTSR